MEDNSQISRHTNVTKANDRKAGSPKPDTLKPNKPQCDLFRPERVYRVQTGNRVMDKLLNKPVEPWNPVSADK